MKAKEVVEKKSTPVIKVSTIEIDTLSCERRRFQRFNTSFMARSVKDDRVVELRGNVTEDGVFFISNFAFSPEDIVDFAVRLPGSGKWIHCGDSMLQTIHRGDAEGAFGYLNPLSNEECVLLEKWRVLSVERAMTHMIH